MKSTTVKSVFLSLMLASALPLAACSDDNDTPTSPTQPGPPVAEAPTTPPPAPPSDPDPTPTPTPPVDNAPEVSASGQVVNLSRSGEGGLDIEFRIDDFTIVRAKGGTPVIIGSATYDTNAVVSNMTVTAYGTRDGGFLDATRIVVDSK